MGNAVAGAKPVIVIEPVCAVLAPVASRAQTARPAFVVALPSAAWRLAAVAPVKVLAVTVGVPLVVRAEAPEIVVDVAVPVFCP